MREETKALVNTVSWALRQPPQSWNSFQPVVSDQYLIDMGSRWLVISRHRFFLGFDSLESIALFFEIPISFVEAFVINPKIVMENPLFDQIPFLRIDYRRFSESDPPQLNLVLEEEHLARNLGIHLPYFASWLTEGISVMNLPTMQPIETLRPTSTSDTSRLTSSESHGQATLEPTPSPASSPASSQVGRRSVKRKVLDSHPQSQTTLTASCLPTSVKDISLPTSVKDISLPTSVKLESLHETPSIVSPRFPTMSEESFSVNESRVRRFFNFSISAIRQTIQHHRLDGATAEIFRDWKLNLTNLMSNWTTYFAAKPDAIRLRSNIEHEMDRFEKGTLLMIASGLLDDFLPSFFLPQLPDSYGSTVANIRWTDKERDAIHWWTLATDEWFQFVKRSFQNKESKFVTATLDEQLSFFRHKIVTKLSVPFFSAVFKPWLHQIHLYETNADLFEPIPSDEVAFETVTEDRPKVDHSNKNTFSELEPIDCDTLAHLCDSHWNHRLKRKRFDQTI